MRADLGRVLGDMAFKAKDDFIVDLAADGLSATIRTWLSGQAQPSAGVIAAYDLSAGAVATRLAQAQKASATTGIDNGSLQAGDKQERLVVAVVGMILDEFNLHKDKHNAILNAIDASTNYATLKTNIAGVPDYPTRTQTQLITALKAKIAATAE